jgi:chromosome segregation ATPase
MDTDLAFQWPGKQNTHSKVSEGQLKDLEQREAALGEAQKQVTAQKAEQEKFDEQLRTREKELEELFKTKEEELDARFKTKEEELDARFKIREELKQQTGENNKSEEYLDDPNKKLREKLDQEFSFKEAVLNKQKEQNDRKEKDLSEREAQLGKSVGASGPSETELLKAENENLKLKLKISELEAEMSRLKNSSAKGSGPKVKVMPKQIPSTPKDSTAKTANMSKPRTNIDGAKADDEAGAIKFDCGHVVYPPPRKLRKKLVGMLYQ